MNRTNPFRTYLVTQVQGRTTVISFRTSKNEFWLDGNYGEFVKMDMAGCQLFIATNADCSFRPVPWIEVQPYYRAQAMLCVCPD